MRSFILLVLSAVPLLAQGTKADYERAQSLDRRTANKVFRTRVEPHWLGTGDAFWYRVETAPGKSETVLVDCLKKTRTAGYVPEKDEKKSLAPDARARRSRTTGAETTIAFINRTPVEVQCFWLDPDGGRK